MSNLHALTQDYVAAFNACDIDAVSVCLADDFTLTDDSVRNLGPKRAALDFISSLFDGVSDKLAFTPRNIYVVDEKTSVIEFDLQLDAMHIEGVDVIKWRDGKMIAMHAYLNVLDL